MSAVSTPTPMMLARRRTMACGPVLGACSRHSRRACSIALICARMIASRARSRRISSRVFGGIGRPSGVYKASIRCGALRNSGLKLRIPRRARTAFPVDKPGALADQGLPLAARALGVLLVQSWDCHPAAVLGPAAHPAQKGTLEQLVVCEKGCLGAQVGVGVARHA